MCSVCIPLTLLASNHQPNADCLTKQCSLTRETALQTDADKPKQGHIVQVMEFLPSTGAAGQQGHIVQVMEFLPSPGAAGQEWNLHFTSKSRHITNSMSAWFKAHAYR